MHTFAMKPTMTVNDKIKMAGEIRLADDSEWGNQDDTGNVGVNAAAGDVYVHRLYMEWLSPMGKVHMGRVSSGAFGTKFLDNDGRANGIKFWPSALASGPWKTYIATSKGTDGDGVSAVNTQSAADNDSYDFRVYYKTDSVDASIRYVYGNNNSVITQATQTDMINPYLIYKTGDYFFAFEGVSVKADTDLDAGGTTETDAKAALVEVGGNFGNLSAALAYVYASGDANATDNQTENALGSSGSEFEPLYILTGSHMGLLNSDVQGADSQGYGMGEAGCHVVALMGDYKVSDRLTLHGAIAIAQADEEVQVGGAQSYANRDDSYGTEYNIGAAYKLLDNLTYEAHFGYLDTGEFFDSAANAGDAESIITLSHHLTMNF
ncbi:MAG: hypothetical protein OEL55_02625 [Desulfobulbaceae bacterium]|nr:hypothetical protein [Desulfobulbaceae bacterium]